MMANNTAGTGAENAVMAGIMPGDAADGGALRQSAACAGAAIPPTAIKRTNVAVNNMNFI